MSGADRLGLRGQNWQRVYYLLALFGVVTVAGGLFLNHRLNGMFHASVAANREWTQRLDAYATLDTLASAVRAPSDEILSLPDPTAQDIAHSEGLITSARVAFEQARQAAYDNAQRTLHGPAQQAILADLQAIEQHYEALVADAQKTFDQLRQKQPLLARRHNALMGRRAVDVNLAITKLQRDAMTAANAQLDAENRAADAERRSEVILAVAMLLMVVGAAAYGYNISRRMRSDTAERERLIAELRNSEATLEQRIAERTEALAKTARRLSDAQRMARLGSWEFDLATQAVTWSSEMFRLFGYEPGEVAPTYERYLGLLHPEDRARSQAAVARALETGEPLDHDERVIRADGVERIFHEIGEVIRNAAGRPIRIAGSAQDVTDTRAAQSALRRSEERFQYVARATNDALWDWDVATGVIWRNEGFQTLFGHRDTARTPDFGMSLIHPDDAPRIRAGIRACLESASEFWTDEYRFKRADGGYAWILDRGYVIRNDAGRAVRMIGSVMDITERKQAESMKSDFVSFVSHQLRTPLSGMSWMLELASETPGIPDAVRGYIADARESSARLSTLVNDLLDIAKLESGRLSAVPESLALSDLTASVVAEMQPLAAGKSLAMNVACDAQVSPVFADAQLLRQAVTNLLSNAVKYTPHGGCIAVSLAQQNGSVTWTVRDSGVGVPKHAQARLFEKFYRAANAISIDSEGTGLGLHLVRLIVEQAGGRVWCESEEGQGATFAFTLPAMTADKEGL
jgi:PAS domain S-box-containing protein